MANQVDFRFQMSTSSPYVLLIKYLSPKNKKTEFPRQNMIVWALAAFWHPIACKWSGSFTDAQLKQKARASIYQLQQQIVYLAHAFGLEKELGTGAITLAHTSANPSNFDTDIEDASAPAPMAVDKSSYSNDSEVNLMSHSDDELLEEAFK